MYTSQHTAPIMLFITILLFALFGQIIGQHGDGKHAIPNQSCVSQDPVWDVIEKYNLNSTIGPEHGVEKIDDAFRFKDYAYLTRNANEVFTEDLVPPQFFFETEIRIPIKSDFMIFEIKNSSSTDQYTVAVNFYDFSSFITVKLPKVNNQYYTVYFDTTGILTDDWHKIKLILTDKMLGLWIDCKAVKDIEGNTRHRMTDFNKFLYRNGSTITLGRDLKHGKTAQFEVKSMKFGCDFEDFRAFGCATKPPAKQNEPNVPKNETTINIHKKFDFPPCVQNNSGILRFDGCEIYPNSAANIFPKHVPSEFIFETIIRFYINISINIFEIFNNKFTYKVQVDTTEYESYVKVTVPRSNQKHYVAIFNTTTLLTEKWHQLTLTVKNDELILRIDCDPKTNNRGVIVHKLDSHVNVVLSSYESQMIVGSEGDSRKKSQFELYSMNFITKNENLETFECENKIPPVLKPVECSNNTDDTITGGDFSIISTDIYSSSNTSVTRETKYVGIIDIKIITDQIIVPNETVFNGSDFKQVFSNYFGATHNKTEIIIL